MRIKILIIIGLIGAILAAAATGTLSTFTVSTGARVGIEPDTQKIHEQYAAGKKPIQAP